MSPLAVFKRWPIAAGLFILHAGFVLLIYIQWASDSSIDRGMIWMTTFIIDLPSSYLFFDRPEGTALHVISAILIGGLQWALVGALLDLLRRFLKKRASENNL